MIKILSIGNSFSHNAQEYLYQLARADRLDMKTVNLYIGGCSLERHCDNLKPDGEQYPLYLNGRSTGYKTTILKALESDEWDFITLQQASHFSFISGSYYPYIVELGEYVRKICPKAKIYIHQTWAYADGSERLKNMRFKTMRDMTRAVKGCYAEAAEKIHAEGIIPSGEAMLELNERWDKPIHADTLHAAEGLPKYLLAQVWFRTLVGRAPNGLYPYVSLTDITDEEAALAAQIAADVTGIRE